MTKYLNGQPFSTPVSTGRMTDRDYKIAVGALVFCQNCEDYLEPGHVCRDFPMLPREDEAGEDA